MVVSKFNWLFKIILVLSIPHAWSADHIYSEVLLKKLNQRIGKILSESAEAQSFVEEDLSEAIQTLDEASIKWQDTFSEFPNLYTINGKKNVVISQYISFHATKVEQVKLVTEFLFSIKRQLDGSTLSIPKVRIQLFAQKFAPLLLSEVDSCSLSISPLPPAISGTQRDEFLTELISLLQIRELTYESTWAASVIWIDAKEYTDGGCRGNNRNLMNLTLTLVHIGSLKSEVIAEVTGSSCGYSNKHKADALSKLLKKIKTQLPKCNHAFRIP